MGIEPTTCRLQGGCTATVLSRREKHFLQKKQAPHNDKRYKNPNLNFEHAPLNLIRVMFDRFKDIKLLHVRTVGVEPTTSAV